MPGHRIHCQCWPRALNVLLAGWIAAALVGCAADPERNTTAAKAHVAKMVSALEAQGDADSLAAAALIGEWVSPARGLELIARAASQAPNRADLAWLNVSLCRVVSDCDPTPLEAHMRAIDPTNGAGWLGPLGRAAERNDGEERVRALGALGRTERFDVYWISSIRQASLAIERLHKWPAPESVVSVIGGMAAVVLPAYQYASRSCKGEALEQSEVLAACRGVARSLMRGDTYLTEMMGIAIGKRVWAADSEEGLRIREEERKQRYRMTAWGKLIPRQTFTNGWAKQYLEFTATVTTEQDLAAAELLRAGVPVDPPTKAADAPT